MKTPFLNRKGFTLIELLIVIAILATLGGISVPVYMTITENAKKTSARNVCTNICQGISNFADDNGGNLPYDTNEAEANSDGQIFLTTTDGKDARMIEILTNNEDKDGERLNTLGNTYLTAQEQEKPADGLFRDASEKLHFYDPWGKPYYVVLCEEDEGCIDPFTAKKRITAPFRHSLVYSTGPDTEGLAPAHSGKGSKKSGKKAPTLTAEEEEVLEDNVYSWKTKK